VLRRLAPATAVALAAALVLVGCSSPKAPEPSRSPSATLSAGALPLHAPTSTPTSTPTAQAGPTDPVSAPASSTTASATGASVAVSASAGGATTTTLANPQKNGAPLVFLVLGQQSGWVRVSLAQRPNGSTGWVKDSAVKLATTPYALVATTEENSLVLYKNGVAQKTYSVATGTGGTPTPHGSFYLTELLAPTNKGYGPYAYGLSAFSDVLNSFGGGPGQIGLHGTDDASSIGTAASHGCIRLGNADISTLAKMLPLGTPIQIR
jgi:lipoprotein-anchoring transpeptidase ErfK/SrfK